MQLSGSRTGFLGPGSAYRLYSVAPRVFAHGAGGRRPFGAGGSSAPPDVSDGRTLLRTAFWYRPVHYHTPACLSRRAAGQAESSW